MVDILHRVGVVAPLDDVYRAVATPEGLAALVDDRHGRQERGRRQLAFRFGDVGGFDMEVLELDPAGRVRWRVIDGPEEWIGTEVDWRPRRSATSTRSSCSSTGAGASRSSSCTTAAPSGRRS